MTAEQISRRSFLILGGSAVLLAATACAPGTTSPPSPAATPPPAAAPTTAQQLIGAGTFFVAHRGSGDNWPEHTLTAYTNALKAGAEAIEVSVCSTSDGVLVCHHDLSGARVLGIDAKISELTWADLERAQVDARVWLGPETPLEPVSRLDTVLAALDDDTIVFIEDKQGTNAKALLDLLDAQPRAQERFVWKQWAPAQQVKAAKERGYQAWGYFDEAEIDRVDEFGSTFDILGVPVSMTDASISVVVSAGRPVMAWEVRYHDDVDRLSSLGVSGMMCANIPYLIGDVAAQDDAFASGRRAAGDLPSQLEQAGWNAQPAFVPERAAVRIQRVGDASYLMGSLAQPGKTLEKLDITLRWPDSVPAEGSVGVTFGLTGDAPGGEGARGMADGYDLHVYTDGAMALIERRDGTVGRTVAEGEIDPPRAGEPISFTVNAGGQETSVEMASGKRVLAAASLPASGPWVRLFKSYAEGTAVEFSGVRSSLA